MLPKIPKSSLNLRPYDFHGLYANYLQYVELDCIIALVGEARHVLELGTNEGRTAKAILRNAPNIERYVGIDVPPHYQTALKAQQTQIPTKWAGKLALDDPRYQIMILEHGSSCIF